MKFIKGIDGWFIRKDKINAVGIDNVNLFNKEFNVIALIENNDSEFYLAEFDDKADAEAWLEKFVADLVAADAEFEKLRTNAMKLANIAVKAAKID